MIPAPPEAFATPEALGASSLLEAVVGPGEGGGEPAMAGPEILATRTAATTRWRNKRMGGAPGQGVSLSIRPAAPSA